MTSLIEVLQIRTQLLQEFVGKSVAHTQPIVAHDSGARARLPAFGLKEEHQALHAIGIAPASEPVITFSRSRITCG
jgi:hypothetical protein